jgi:cell division protein FtsB
MTEWINRGWDWVYRSRRKLATAGVVLLAVQLAWHVIFGANGFVVYANKRSEYHKLQTETEQLQQDNQKLQERVQSLKSDPKTIEKEAREQLRYARPGEIIYTTPAPPPPQPPANTTAQKQ